MKNVVWKSTLGWSNWCPDERKWTLTSVSHYKPSHAYTNFILKGSDLLMIMKLLRGKKQKLWAQANLTYSRSHSVPWRMVLFLHNIYLNESKESYFLILESLWTFYNIVVKCNLLWLDGRSEFEHWCIVFLFFTC